MSFSPEAQKRAEAYLKEIAEALGADVELREYEFSNEPFLYHHTLQLFLKIAEIQSGGYRRKPLNRLYVTIASGYERDAKKFHESKGKLDTQAVIEYCREYIKGKLDSRKRQRHFDALKDVAEAELRLVEEGLGGRLYGVSAVLLPDGSPGARFKLTVPTSELEKALKLIEENGWSI